MRDKGFTIIEVLIVVGLISLLSVALMAQIGGGSGQYLETAASVIEANLRYASERAIGTGRLHRLMCDLDNQRFRIESQQMPEDDEEEKRPTSRAQLELSPPIPALRFEPARDRAGQWRWLDQEDVLIEKVVIGDSEYDDGTASIAFSGDGAADPGEIWLTDDDGYAVGLRVQPFTGEVARIEEGP